MNILYDYEVDPFKFQHINRSTKKQLELFSLFIEKKLSSLRKEIEKAEKHYQCEIVIQLAPFFKGVMGIDYKGYSTDLKNKMEAKTKADELNFIFNKLLELSR